MTAFSDIDTIFHFVSYKQNIVSLPGKAGITPEVNLRKDH